MLMVMWLSALGIFVPICAENHRYRSVRQTTANGSPHKTQTGLRSLLECAAVCSADVSSDACGYDATSGTCRMFTWQGLSLGNPNSAGQEARTVIIRRKLEIVMASSWGGQQVAEDICRVFGGEISTYEELSYAFYNYDLHVGTCGRVSSGTLYYALQYEVPGIGYQGINNCYWITDGNVFFVMASSWGGQQVAEDICRVFGGEIATYEELSYAFYNYDLHVGTCGRVSSGTLYYALQYEVSGIGYRGINDCFWKTDGNVFCTIPAPV